MRAGLIASAVLAVTLVLSAAAGAQPSPQDRGFTGDREPDQTISACTAYIESNQGAGRPRAEAYRVRAHAYSRSGDFERAVADYTEAIRLDPTAESYQFRGQAYASTGKFDRAMADYESALKLDPKMPAAYNARGTGHAIKGHYDLALADHNEAIRLEPTFIQAYQERGLTYYTGRALPEALADFSKLHALAPAYPFALLWIDIIETRMGRPRTFAQKAAKVDMNAWPAPAIRMFLGEMTPAAVLAVADDPDPRKKAEQVCETHFYAGQMALRQGAKDEAVRRFQLAASSCTPAFIEWRAAKAELLALGVGP